MKKTNKFPLEIKRGSVVTKIYRPPTANGYDSFTLVYWQDQFRKREVFGDLAAAKKRGESIAKALAKGEVGATKISAQDSAAFLRATALLRPTGAGLESACREFSQATKLLKGVSVLYAASDYVRRHAGEITSKSVRNVVEEFLAAKRDGRATRLGGNVRKVSDRYLGDLEQKLNTFAGSFSCAIGMVSASQITDFISNLKTEGRTKNNYRQAISVFFEFAKKQKYVPRDQGPGVGADGRAYPVAEGVGGADAGQPR